MSPHDESERLQAVALRKLDAEWERWKTMFEVLSSSQGELASKRLAEEPRAYIEGRVVSAYETGSSAEAKKWVQRNKALTAASAAAVLALLGGIDFS